MADKSPFTFKSNKFSSNNKFGGNRPSFNSDMLFNKKKISNDVLSMSSSSSSSRSSASGDDDDASSKSSVKYYNDPPITNKNYSNDDDDEIEEDDETEDSDGSEEEDNEEEVNDEYSKFKKDKKELVVNELNEKREILYQIDRLESKGYKIPFKFNMESNLEEMKNEYNKLIREKEIDASIRFQRKMLMAFVTGTEYLNSRYDPFAIKLEGWSDNVYDNINDYDDIFEELHDKYKSSGKKMSPEVRLFISLSGSAFVFHLTNRMFKETPLPNVENVLRSNPELMKQFQEAAAKQYIFGNNQQPQQQYKQQPQQQPQQPQYNNNSGGIFGMVSNLFNNIGGGGLRQQAQQFRNREDDEVSITSYKKNTDNIIKSVHTNIDLDNNHNNNIETLSISDEEITSIIEDTADLKILTGRNKKKNNRTLNI